MSSLGAAVNIPTFVADLPPSPRSKRLQNVQETGAKCGMDTSTTKVNEGLRAASINAPIPSMILQESAEEEQTLSHSGVRTDQHRTTSLSHSVTDSAHAVQGVAVTAGSSDVRLVSAAPVAALPSAMVQVMLQLPGSNYQLPVNIPAETILPALTKYLPKLPPATVAVTTGSSGIILKQEAQKVDAGLTTSVLPSGSKAEDQRLSEIVAPQTKIPRLANTVARTSAEPTTVPQLYDNPLASSYTSSSVISDSDADDNSQTLQSNNNRNAATRCRQKKKQQIEKMEQKAKELQAENMNLEVEMKGLRKDIQQLETLLIQHGDCFQPSSTLLTAQASDSA